MHPSDQQLIQLCHELHEKMQALPACSSVGELIAGRNTKTKASLLLYCLSKNDQASASRLIKEVKHPDRGLMVAEALWLTDVGGLNFGFNLKSSSLLILEIDPDALDTVIRHICVTKTPQLLNDVLSYPPIQQNLSSIDAVACQMKAWNVDPQSSFQFMSHPAVLQHASPDYLFKLVFEPLCRLTLDVSLSQRQQILDNILVRFQEPSMSIEHYELVMIGEIISSANADMISCLPYVFDHPHLTDAQRQNIASWWVENSHLDLDLLFPALKHCVQTMTTDEFCCHRLAKTLHTRNWVAAQLWMEKTSASSAQQVVMDWMVQQASPAPKIQAMVEHIGLLASLFQSTTTEEGKGRKM